MQRLVYSPKASAYIKTEDDRIVDVTNDIVRGEVHRKINQVSSATLTLRNDQRKYTSKGNPTFRPMDPITIYLNRLPGFPVQVFTGFLDKTPYFQLYPGTVELTASCTLKRLQYTYWDPALPYVNEFMAQYGWVANRATGELYNPQAAVGLANDQSATASGSSSATGVSPTSTSGVSRTEGDILFLGDSLSVGTAGAMKSILGSKWKITQSNHIGFTTAQALAVLNLPVPTNIPQTIVVQLGTNDFNAPAFKKSALGIMAKLGKDRRVIWGNVGRLDSMFPGQTTAAQINEQLNKVANQYPNIEIFNFNGLVASGNIGLGSDGVHPTSYTQVGKLLSKVIGSASTAPTPTTGGSSTNVKIVLRKVDVKGEAEAALNDGSIGNLLFATLKRIGGWDPSTIYIEKLPDGSNGTVSLATVVSRLYESMNEQIAITEDALTTFLGGSIGQGTYGDGSTSTSPDGADESTGNIKGLDKIIPTIVKIANKWNVPAEVPIAIGLIETGLTNHDSPGNPHYGWYQWDKKSGPAGSYSGAGVTKSKDNGCYDLGFATDSICEGLHNLAVRNPAIKSDTLGWAMKIQGVNGQNNPLYPQTWGSQLKKAQSYMSQYKLILGDVTTGLGTLPGPSVQTVTAKKKDGTTPADSVKITQPSEVINRVVLPLAGKVGIKKTVAQNNIDNANHGPTVNNTRSDHQGPPEFAWAADMSNSPKGNYDTTAPTPEMDRLAATLAKAFDMPWSGSGVAENTAESKSKTGLRYQMLYRTPAGGGHFNHVHFGVKKISSGTGWVGVPGADAIADPTSSNTGTASGGTTDGTTDALTTARASAFAASFNFPTAEQMMEAIGLQGDRSLLNDQPLLPFIQQLTEGSMRHFQSMPNGNFFAFFPDYFGTFGHRKAYWEIDDIEILDGKLELNDDALVTHMYVIGDTILPNNTIDFVEKLLSRGVVTVFNAGAANWLAPKDNQSENFFGDRDTTLKFLKRYGARPQYEPSPFIRSAYYEIYVAWQKFMQAWSRQFISTFTFTFMPELYPGGIVAFPTHGIQMYIEEVHHSFDYEGGFTTQANLSSPASTDSNNDITRGLLPKAAPFSNDFDSHTTADPNTGAKNALKNYLHKNEAD